MKRPFIQLFMIFTIFMSINLIFSLCHAETPFKVMKTENKLLDTNNIIPNDHKMIEKVSIDHNKKILEGISAKEPYKESRNDDMFYLGFVALFLIAGISLMLWNRAREKIAVKEANDHNNVGNNTNPSKKSPPSCPPEIKKEDCIDYAAENTTRVKMWYYSIDGQSKHGPIPEGELRDLLDSRRLLPDTLVWTNDLPYWRKAEEIKF